MNLEYNLDQIKFCTMKVKQNDLPCLLYLRHQEICLIAESNVQISQLEGYNEDQDIIGMYV